MWINLPGLTSLMVITSLCGMVVYAQYKDCDPMKSGRIAATDQVRQKQASEERDKDAQTFGGHPFLLNRGKNF